MRQTDLVSVGQAWRRVRDRFASADIQTSALDARLLAEQVFGWDGVQLLANEHSDVAPDLEEQLNDLAQRRLAGEPVARILGHKEFYGLDFALNEATLVPRPETELLVDLGLEVLKERKDLHILDLGTGSGCIATTFAVKLPESKIVAVDLDPKALSQARLNAQRHQVADRVDFREGSWFAPLKQEERFDLIVSNPPYIETETISDLSSEVRLHEPILALDGGVDGLAPYRLLAEQAGGFLEPGGAMAVEIGIGQATAVVPLLNAAGFKNTHIHNDLAGISRVILSLS